jgi:hypothetical protein
VSGRLVRTLRLQRLGLLVLALAGLILTGAAPEPAWAQVETPAAGTPVRKAILDALRPVVAAELGAPIVFSSVDMRVLGEWAFVTAVPQRPGGGAIAYLYTRYQTAWENDVFGGAVAALLRDTPAGWLVYEYDLGATDVVWLDWHTYYPVPPEVFPGN